MKTKVITEVEMSMEEVIKAVAFNILGTTLNVYHEWQHGGDKRVGLLLRIVTEDEDK